jgi:isopenicillin N synthase-like dioxygenase
MLVVHSLPRLRLPYRIESLRARAVIHPKKIGEKSTRSEMDNQHSTVAPAGTMTAGGDSASNIGTRNGIGTMDDTDAMNDTGAMGAMKLPFTKIPTIDIAALLGSDPVARRAVAEEIGRACEDVGFFYIRNHGIPESLIARVYERSAQFHHSPAEWRERVHVQNSQGNRGWLPSTLAYHDPDPELYRLTTAGEDDYLLKPRLHSAFDLSLEIDEDDPAFLAGSIMLVPNQWPDWLPGFREDVVAYYNAVMALGNELFRAFAIALDLPESFFVDKATKPTSQLRLLHYPPNDMPMDRKHLGIVSHSDFECFTILNQRSAGLQVMNSADEWVEAPPLDGTFIVNIGDLLEGWTNGRFKATQHRVVNTGRERYSLPLFFAVDYDTVVEPLPQFVTPERPAAYTRIVAGEHLAGFVIQDTKHLRKKVLRGELKVDFPIHEENPFKRKAVNEFLG